MKRLDCLKASKGIVCYRSFEVPSYRMEMHFVQGYWLSVFLSARDLIHINDFLWAQPWWQKTIYMVGMAIFCVPFLSRYTDGSLVWFSWIANVSFPTKKTQ